MRASRIRVVEIVVAVSVVMISVASLGVALFQGHVMQRTLEAQVLPVIQYGDTNYDDARREWRMELSLTNTGLGPAELRWSQISWRGVVLSEPAALMVLCCVPDEIPQEDRYAYVQSVFETGHMRIFFDEYQGRYFAPQETVTFISFPRPDPALSQEAYDIWTRLDRVRNELEVEVCYCSVFEDCWMASFPAQSRERVDRCPDDET
jgi:hypothetical protein